MSAHRPGASPTTWRLVIANLSIRYFAVLREQAGHSGETISTAATTPGQLYGELRRKYDFSLPADMVRVAVNQEYRTMDHPLAEGDEVVFIPPVSGG